MRQYSFVYFGYDNDYNVALQNQLALNFQNVFSVPAPNKRLSGINLFFYRTLKSIDKKYFKFSNNFWLKMYLPNRVERKIAKWGGAICFVILSQKFYVFKEKGLLDYLKQKFPLCKFIVDFDDKVELDFKMRPDFNLDEIKKEVSFCMTYNEYDAIRYDLLLKPPIAYDYSFVINDKSIASSDVFYIGTDKGRYEHIVDIYEKCRANGLICDFHIVNLDASKKLVDGMHYHGYVKYVKMLRWAKQANCILNYEQENATGFTLRDFEAMGMGKLLMTNKKDFGKYGCDRDNVISINDIEGKAKIIKNSKGVIWNLTKELQAKRFFEWLNFEINKKENK